MKTLTFISCTLGIGLLLACGVDPVVLGELVEAAERGDDASDAPPPENTDPPSDADDEDLDLPPGYPNPPSSHEEFVEALLLRYCGDCHDGEPEASAAGVGVIGDIDALIALDLGLIVPGSREDSSVYTRMVDGDMPPLAIEAPRPSDEEIEYIGQFIDAMD